jgi:uncharacterized protein YjiS (DUF1127 family)
MSCANATCAQIIQAKRPPASVPDLEWTWRLPLRPLARMARYFERRRQRRELLERDDRFLADIGLSRQEVVEDAFESCRARLAIWRDHR